MSKTILLILQHPEFPENKVWWQEEFDMGKTIVDEGEKSQDVYLMLQGTARVSKKVDIEDDKYIKPGLGEYKAGDTFGELNLFDASVRSASIVAESNAIVARIDAKALSDFLDSNPGLGYKVLKEYFLGHASLLRSANNRFSRMFAWGLKQHGIDQHL